MTRLHLCLSFAAVAAAVALLPACSSGPKPPEERTIRGQAVVEKAGDGTITAIRINARKRSRVYNVNLDEKGKQLADEVGKNLVITGMYQRKNDERWITVKEFHEEGTGDDKKGADEKKGAAEKKPAEGKKAPEEKAPDEKAPEEKAPEEGAPEEKAPEEK